MATQAHVQAGQQGDKETRYKDLLAQLAKARNDPIFQNLVNPPMEEEHVTPPIVVS